MGRISRGAGSCQAVVFDEVAAGWVDQSLQGCELRMDAEPRGVGVPVRKLQLVGGVDLGPRALWSQLVGLSAQCFRAVA